jgi:hypothetical protein
MNIEYEATFTNVNKEKVREILKDKGGELIRPEFLQKRMLFLPGTMQQKLQGLKHYKR